MSDPNQIRINKLARELEIKAKMLIDYLPEIGVTEKKTHSSSIEVEQAVLVRKHFQQLAAEEAAAEEAKNPKAKPAARPVAAPPPAAAPPVAARPATAAPPATAPQAGAVPRPAVPGAPVARLPIPPPARPTAPAQTM